MRYLQFVALLTIALVAVPADAGTIVGLAKLDGLQEVPSNASPAVGTLAMQVDDVTGQFSLDMFVAGISVGDLAGAGPNGSPVHIHAAPAGANGPIVVDLGFLGTITPLSGGGFKLSVTNATFGGVQGALNGPAPTTNITDLLAGGLYANVHTTGYGGGEVRGQINAFLLPEPDALALACLGGLVLAFFRRRKPRCPA